MMHTFVVCTVPDKDTMGGLKKDQDIHNADPLAMLIAEQLFGRVKNLILVYRWQPKDDGSCWQNASGR